MSEPYPEQVLAEFERCLQQNSWPWVETGQIAEAFPETSDKTVKKRLKRLEKSEQIAVRTVGAGALCWYEPNQSDEFRSMVSPSSDSQ